MALTYSLQRSQGYPSYPPAQRLTGGTLPETALVAISVMPATFLPLHPIMQSSFFLFPSSHLSLVQSCTQETINKHHWLTTTSTTSIFSSYILYYLFHPISSFVSFIVLVLHEMFKAQINCILHFHFCFKGEQETRLLLTLTKATSSHTHTHTHTLYTLNHAAASAPFSAPPKAVLKKRPGCLKSFLGNWDETKLQHRLTQSCPGRCFNSRNN